jgi:hypothetical protein
MSYVCSLPAAAAVAGRENPAQKIVAKTAMNLARLRIAFSFAVQVQSVVGWKK